MPMLSAGRSRVVDDGDDDDNEPFAIGKRFLVRQKLCNRQKI